MKKCKHDGDRITAFTAPPSLPGTWRDPALTQYTDIKKCNICETCGEWLPLGPAPDRESDRVERRAAEIAASGRNGSGIATWGEHDGWHAISRKPPASARPYRARPRQLAGYLARCIVEHKS